jgi:hypothetical protein
VPDREVLNDERHPVVAGLVALVGVGLAVGLIAGLAALVGVQVLGIGNAGASSQSTDAQSLYLPRPKPTKGPSGPLVTLPGDPSTKATEGSEKPKKKDKKPEKQKQEEEITLSASATSVSQMEQIDLTGVYPGGEGAILQVQRFTGGKWTDFPVTVSVSDETFSTYVQTSQGGANRFRMVDTDTGKISNEVKITVG